MRTITMTAAVLKTIKSDADREIFAQMEGAEVPEDIVKDMASEPTYQGLFADNNHVIADLMINDSDETDTTNAQEGTTMTDTTTLTIAGFNLPPRTKGDRAYLGKEIPIGKASKALLVDLVAKLQVQPQSEPQPQPQQQRQQQSPQARLLGPALPEPEDLAAQADPVLGAVPGARARPLPGALRGLHPEVAAGARGHPGARLQRQGLVLQAPDHDDQGQDLRQARVHQHAPEVS